VPTILARRLTRLFIPIAALLLLTNCGYIGDPLPPLANVPLPVKDLGAMQRGDRIVVQFTAPTLTTEGHPIPPPVLLDLRAGPADQFEESQWAASARHIPAGTVADSIARYEIPVAGWTGKEIIFGARVVAGNGKESPWSNFVVVPIVAPPDKPAGLTATATPQGVRLTWQARATSFRVFRKAGDIDYTAVADVTTPEWTDTATEFGKSYSYIVQGIVKLDDKRTAESEKSSEISIVPRDVFPPAPPKGIQASLAPNSIELNWDRNAEPDMAGYRVYRAEGGGAFEKVADIQAIPSYSDRSVEHGKTYHYAISAFDQAGNESPRSAPLDVAMP